MRAYWRVMSRDRCPRSAAIASMDMPRFDCLGRQGAPEPVWVNVADPGLLGDCDPALHRVAVQWPVLPAQHPAMGVRWDLTLVGADEFDEVGVQRDVAVVVELAGGDPQPVPVTNHRDCVGLQIAELPDSHPGPGQQLDREAGVEAVLVAECSYELHVVGVVEEPGQRFVAFGEVTEEDRHPGRRIRPVPFDDPDEKHAQHADPPPERRVLIVPFMLGWACCHTLNASTWERSMSAAPASAGS